MNGHRAVAFSFGLAGAVALILASNETGSPAPPAPAQQKQSPIKIGIVNSVFRDVSESTMQSMIPEFQALMREQTGLDGEVATAADVHDLGKQLHDKQVQLGVFQGFEFAWARQEFPDLKPLLVAEYRQQRNLKAFVAVLKEKPAASLADLKGKVLSIPRRCPEHCHLFLERELSAMGTTPKDFFGKIVSHPNAEEALDDVLRDKVQAVLVDGVGLESYEQVNPGRFARLKVVAKGEGFPPSLVAIRPGVLDEATINKLKSGMLGAHNTVRGKEQLALWKLTSFENVPLDLDAKLDDMVKRYPPPKTKEAPVPAKAGGRLTEAVD